MPDNRIVRKIIQRYWRLTRGLTLGTQGIVLDDNRQVLLVRHGYRSGWHFPGGGVEKNETLMTALTRELREEAGVILGEAPELLGIYANFRLFPSDHVVVYVVRQWQRLTIPPPSFEIQEQGFFPIDKLPETTVSLVRRRLAELLDGRPRDADW